MVLTVTRALQTCLLLHASYDYPIDHGSYIVLGAQGSLFLRLVGFHLSKLFLLSAFSAYRKHSYVP